MEKIEALKKTIYNLENNVYEYNWGDYENCNCGILAKSILGEDNLRKNGIGNAPCSRGFGASSEYFCMTTDLPLPAVFQAVKDAGFTYKEMVELETFDNSEIVEKAGVERCGYKNKPELIKYLKAWVEILEEQIKPAEEKPKEIIRYVSVPQTLTNQVRELIEN